MSVVVARGGEHRGIELKNNAAYGPVQRLAWVTHCMYNNCINRVAGFSVYKMTRLFFFFAQSLGDHYQVLNTN